MATISEDLALAIRNHQAGRLDEAERSYRKFLQANPNHAGAWHLLGGLYYQVRNYDLAVPCLERAAALMPGLAGIHCDLGLAFQDQGNLARAIASYLQALALQPDHAEAYSRLGSAYFAQANLRQAADCFRRAIELQPGNAELHNDLGNALKGLGALNEAIACYSQGLALNPSFVEAHNNLGAVFQEQGRLAEAVACYRRALELKPDFAQAYFNLGTAYRTQENLSEAAACYGRAIEIDPDYAEAHSNLGNAFKDLGRLDEAVACYRRALEIKPSFVEAHNNLGNALKDQGKLDLAIACYRRTLELNPSFAVAYNNLGMVWRDQGKLDEAAIYYRQALDLNPNYAEALNNFGTALKDQAKLDDAISHYRQALALRPNFASAHSNLLNTLHFCQDFSAAAICEEHRRWNQQQAAHRAELAAPHANDASSDRRLRIGYVSPDFRTHCQAFFTVPLFAAHDHRQFEIFCYSTAVTPDDMTARLRSCADHWRNIAGVSDQHLAELVRQDQIDILVDLTMHMARNRLLALAHKPAPVQVCWLAYPGTTGLATMDYRLTDPYLDPPGHHDGNYTEESIHLPDTFWCYDPLDAESAVNALPAVEAGHVTFGSLNNFCKVNSSTLKLWARVLKAVDQSRLVLLADEGSHRQSTLDFLEQEGIARNRVTFFSRQSRQRYLELYHRIDIGLDTLPYNGHTTSLDAFWMGVPVITIVGQSVVGRAGLSQLSNLGLPELIAQTPAQFVQIAAELAGDLTRLSKLRASLRERMTRSPLMDAPRFARGIESAYRWMWQRWCDKSK